MRAEESQLPGIQVKADSQTHVPGKGTDTLWASVRRLKAQVEHLELALSTARRDINRIDKGQYRDKSKSPPSEITEQPGNGDKSYHPALFG